MDKTTHDILKKEDEILQCEHRIENKINRYIIPAILTSIAAILSSSYYAIQLYFLFYK